MFPIVAGGPSTAINDDPRAFSRASERPSLSVSGEEGSLPRANSSRSETVSPSESAERGLLTTLKVSLDSNVTSCHVDMVHPSTSRPSQIPSFSESREWEFRWRAELLAPVQLGSAGWHQRPPPSPAPKRAAGRAAP